MTTNRLPPLTELSAYKKLTPPNNAISDTSELEVVVMKRRDIRLIADGLHE